MKITYYERSLYCEYWETVTALCEKIDFSANGKAIIVDSNGEKTVISVRDIVSIEKEG